MLPDEIGMLSAVMLCDTSNQQHIKFISILFADLMHAHIQCEKAKSRANETLAQIAIPVIAEAAATTIAEFTYFLIYGATLSMKYSLKAPVVI